MNAESFTEYLKNPSKLYQVNYQELKSLALQYPYCQNLQWLLLQKSRMDGHKDADANLEKTATLSVDRKMLYKKMKSIAATQNSNGNYLVVDEVLELPNLTSFRRPEPIPIEPIQIAPLENRVPILFPQEDIIKPFIPKEEEGLDMSKLQVPPKPLELPEISPDPLPNFPTTPEVPQPSDPTPMPTIPTPEIPNPFDPDPVLPSEEPETEVFEENVAQSIEWDVKPQQVSESNVEAKPNSVSRARHYQPPTLQFKTATIPVKSKEAQVAEMAAKSITEKDELVSETLAHILAKQGHYAKAIKMYEQLILKFPEKSDNFAAQIQKLKQF